MGWALRGYSLNANGFNNVTQRTLNFFSSNFHAVGVQETKFTGVQGFKRAKHLWKRASQLNSSFWSQDNTNNYSSQAGVGLLLTPTCPIQDLEDQTTQYVSSTELLRRYLVVRGTLDSVATYIHVVYAPVQPTQRAQFFNSLPRHFDAESHHIVLGDLNTVLSSQLDQANHADRNRIQGREELLSWMADLHLIDAWRLQNPDLQEFTSPNRSSRIDYVLVSSRLFHSAFQEVQHDFRQSAGQGDHCGIRFRLGSAILRPNSRAPWRCPEWVIELPEAQEYLSNSLIELATSFRAPSFKHYNPGCLLDEHKRRDSIFLRELFAAKKNERQRVIENLHLRVNEVRHIQALNPGEDFSQALNDARAQLQEKLEEQAHYSSKQKFASDFEDSEKCSKYFFRPPQVLHRTPIPVETAEDLEPTCAAFNEYWSGVYCSPSREYTHQKPRWNRLKLAGILQHTKTRLTPAQQAYLDSPFTANDFFGALKNTAAGKTPGPDGLPLAYYKVNLPLWSRVLEVVYAAQLQRGKMTKFQRRAQVSLLYKKGDRKQPSNYRPISLLNVDAKLGPKILAHRLSHVLASLLHTDQYGFVPRRDIRHAHLRFQALAQLYSSADTPAGAVLLDFAKAFDSVVWDALDMVLMHFGFGETFRRWVRVIFPGTLVSLLFNGRPLKPFELGAGVRQGDPLSPALFVLFIEPLLNFIRAKLGTAGLRCDYSAENHSVISFADDCTGLLHSLRDTKTFLGLVEEFCEASGMRLNKEKTVVLPFRPWTESTEALRQSLLQLGVTVVGNDGCTKLLGIFYGPSLPNAARLQHLLAEMQLRCSLWINRARTLRGQVVILQQIILPVLWYSASVCHVPQTGFQDQVSTLIARFLNRSKSASVLPRTWWSLPPSKGGLGLTPVMDSVRSLQLSMLCKLIVAVRTFPTALHSWTTPVIHLFNSAVSPWGRDFDILYAPVTTSPDYVVARRLPRWKRLGSYWHSVLFTWHTLLRQKIVRAPNKFDKLTTPFLDNVDLPSGYRGRTLAGASVPVKLISLLAERGIFRPLELFAVCGNPVTAETLSNFLQQPSSARAFGLASCSNFLNKIGRLLGALVDFPVGPLRSVRYFGAFHSWVFSTYDVAELSVSKLRTILAHHVIPDLPLHRLGIDEAPQEQVWQRDCKLNKQVLPVYADFLYRLQHNALYLGYRLQHLPEATSMCHHGCGALETAPHLFWYCDFATQIWEGWLSPFRNLFSTAIEWGSVLFFNKLEPTPEAKRRFGYSLFVTFHIVRAVILRCLWMHRNNIRFHDHQPNLIDVKAQVQAVITLHLERFRQATILKQFSHSSLLRRQLLELLDSLPLGSRFSDATTAETL